MWTISWLGAVTSYRFCVRRARQKELDPNADIERWTVQGFMAEINMQKLAGRQAGRKVTQKQRPNHIAIGVDG